MPHHNVIIFPVVFLNTTSLLAERMSLLAKHSSYSNILRKSHFLTGHCRQYVSRFAC